MEVYHCIFGLTIFLCFVTFSQSDKPSGLSQGIYCEGCIATVKELLKKINKKTGESREVTVIEAMEDICNLQNFGSYEYSPPKTGQACKFLIENYDEEIEMSLVAESGDFEQKICYKLSEACKGVDRTKKEKEEMEVNINDQKQKLHSGGGAQKDPEQFNVNINEEGAAAKLVDQINMAIKNKKNVGGDEDDEEEDDDDEEEDDDEEDDDDEKDDGDNKINEDADLDDAKDEDIENLTDNLKDAKTEL